MYVVYTLCIVYGLSLLVCLLRSEMKSVDFRTCPVSVSTSHLECQQSKLTSDNLFPSPAVTGSEVFVKCAHTCTGSWVQLPSLPQPYCTLTSSPLPVEKQCAIILNSVLYYYA